MRFELTTSVVLLQGHPFCNDSDLLREVAFLDGDNLLVFYYLCSYEIWPDKRGGLWWEWSYKMGTSVHDLYP